VCFVWSEHDRHGRLNVVELDPGGGFGTGEHPSARMLLEELAARVRGGERVLDVGCGSGILALSALRLGAASAVGTDILATAVKTTTRNAGLNGFARQVRATAAPPSEMEGTFDVVVANIGRAALVELAPALLARLSPSGWLAVSGSPPPSPLSSPPPSARWRFSIRGRSMRGPPSSSLTGPPTNSGVRNTEMVTNDGALGSTTERPGRPPAVRSLWPRVASVPLWRSTRLRQRIASRVI
jgi:SAM-dependent methyltransferase